MAKTLATDPLPPRRDSHRPLAERQPRERKGVEHTVSHAKTLRMNAKKWDKQIAKADKEYKRGKSTMMWSAWNALLEQRDRAWDEALPNPHHPDLAPTQVSIPALLATQDDLF